MGRAGPRTAQFVSRIDVARAQLSPIHDDRLRTNPELTTQPPGPLGPPLYSQWGRAKQ